VSSVFLCLLVYSVGVLCSVDQLNEMIKLNSIYWSKDFVWKRYSTQRNEKLKSSASLGLFLLFVLLNGSSSLKSPEYEWSLDGEIQRLNCRVTAGSRLIVDDKINGIEPKHAKSLWIRCEGDSTESHVLSDGNFMAVPNLGDLVVYECRIAGVTAGAFPYLPYLQIQEISSNQIPNLVENLVLGTESGKSHCTPF
jgi:hypothetical protein